MIRAIEVKHISTNSGVRWHHQLVEGTCIGTDNTFWVPAKALRIHQAADDILLSRQKPSVAETWDRQSRDRCLIAQARVKREWIALVFTGNDVDAGSGAIH